MSANENLAAALVLQRDNKPNEAVIAAMKALEQDPTLAAAWECVAFIYMRHGQWPTALGLLERAVELAPGHVTLDLYYALALAEMGDVEKAQTRIDELHRREPANPHVLFAKAEILCAGGQHDRAIAVYAAAQKHDAVKKSASFGHAGARFITGDFMGALPGLAALEDEAADAPPLPLWDGSQDPMQHILVYGSQGFGDILMLLRYMKHLPAGKVTLRIPHQLAHLVRESFPDLPLVASKDPGDVIEVPLPSGVGFDLPKDATARCSLLRLSWMVTGAFDTRAADVPYLRADSGEISAWKKRLEHLPHPRIGIVWAGSPRNGVNHRRSLPFEMLQPLITDARKHLIALQMGPEKERLAGTGIFDASYDIRDFADSAALLSVLDLLITVDTAPAHLAGALGRPVWNLMPFNPTDWRWLLGREDTLWYPSMRLFRQAKPGDWAGVMGSVSFALKPLLPGS